MTDLVVLAHAGHWIVSLGFFGPVIVLPLALWLLTLHQRRAK